MKKQKPKRNSKKLWRQKNKKTSKTFKKLKKLQSNFQKGFALFIFIFLLFFILIYFIGVIFDKYA